MGEAFFYMVPELPQLLIRVLELPAGTDIHGAECVAYGTRAPSSFFLICGDTTYNLTLLPVPQVALLQA